MTSKPEEEAKPEPEQVEEVSEELTLPIDKVQSPQHVTISQVPAHTAGDEFAMTVSPEKHDLHDISSSQVLTVRLGFLDGLLSLL